VNDVGVNFAPPEVIIRDMLKPQIAVDDFLADMRRRRLSERTVTTYARTLDEFTARPEIVDLDVSKITATHVTRYLATKSRLARGTVSGIETHLFMWFEFCCSRRRSRATRWTGWCARSGSPPRSRRRHRRDRRRLRLLEVAHGPAPSATRSRSSRTSARAGTRRAAALTPTTTATRARSASARRATRRSGSRPDELRSVLDASIAARRDLAGAERLPRPARGLPAAHRRPRRPRHLAAREEGRRRAGVDAHVHALRAAFAVFYLERKRDTLGLQELMGPPSMKTTEVYLRRLDKRRAMEPRPRAVVGVALAGNDDAPQPRKRALASSPGVGAGGFEPPFR
jgi:site-specific recombinase XerC